MEIKKQVKPGDYMVVRGSPQIYFYSETRFLGRHAYGVPGGNKTPYLNLAGEYGYVTGKTRIPQSLIVEGIQDQVNTLRNPKTRFIAYHIPKDKLEKIKKIFKSYGFVYLPQLSRNNLRVFKKMKVL